MLDLIMSANLKELKQVSKTSHAFFSDFFWVFCVNVDLSSITGFKNYNKRKRSK
jgi:hypothetical protein